MAVMTQLTDAEVKAIADAVLAREMSALSFEAAAVTSGPDSDGLPALFVAAIVGPGVPGLDGASFARIHGALHEALLACGEERFPHFSLARSDDEVPEDDMPRGED